MHHDCELGLSRLWVEIHLHLFKHFQPYFFSRRATAGIDSHASFARYFIHFAEGYLADLACRFLCYSVHSGGELFSNKFWNLLNFYFDRNRNLLEALRNTPNPGIVYLLVRVEGSLVLRNTPAKGPKRTLRLNSEVHSQAELLIEFSSGFWKVGKHRKNTLVRALLASDKGYITEMVIIDVASEIPLLVAPCRDGLDCDTRWCWWLRRWP